MAGGGALTRSPTNPSASPTESGWTPAAKSGPSRWVASSQRSWHVCSVRRAGRPLNWPNSWRPPTACCSAGARVSRIFGGFLGSLDDLLRNILGRALVAELDGDELGYLVAGVAEIKRRR